MSQKPTFQTNGIVLRVSPFRESDIIASLLAEQFGKISMIVRGAKRSRRRFFGGIDLFDCGNFVLTPPKGQSDLFTLEAISERTVWPGLRSQLTSFGSGALALECTARLAFEGDPEGGTLYNPLFSLLSRLGSQQTDRARSLSVLIEFLDVLLQVTGFHCSDTNEHLSPRTKDLLSETKHGVVQFEEEKAQAALHELLGYIEAILGKPLVTRNEFFRASANC